MALQQQLGLQIIEPESWAARIAGREKINVGVGLSIGWAREQGRQPLRCFGVVIERFRPLFRERLAASEGIGRGGLFAVGVVDPAHAARLSLFPLRWEV
ncbi:hypothetical protein [Methylocystis iwaonis]|uniref:LysR substrate-binding domain-containing protein n=1 Tax=Methylocystis iwaonis TaxID=2885079 RepID=A0ABM8E3I9_9HYPH|nr:hypothetical protein [Methylocystis iwaonis]BDV32572.1 hypothetical protein SS37A_01010 [Methylocystis iwaonis]